MIVSMHLGSETWFEHGVPTISNYLALSTRLSACYLFFSDRALYFDTRSSVVDTICLPQHRMHRALREPAPAATVIATLSDRRTGMGTDTTVVAITPGAGAGVVALVGPSLAATVVMEMVVMAM